MTEKLLTGTLSLNTTNQPIWLKSHFSCVPAKQVSRGKRGRSFSEGWVELINKKVAKRVAAALNNTQIGGKWKLVHWSILNIMYCKNPKNLDTQNICCNHPKIWTRWLYHRVMHSKDTDRIANSAHPDQTAPALFAQTYMSENLGSLRYFVVGLCQSIYLFW